MSYKRLLLQSAGILGCLLFLPLFILTFVDPNVVEKSGREFVQWQVELSVSDKIDGIDISNRLGLERLLTDKARQMLDLNDEQSALIKVQLKDGMPAMLAQQLAQMYQLDCECRQNWELKLTEVKMERLSSLAVAREKLVVFSQAKYMEVVVKLTSDVRIFLGVNSLVFLMLLLLALSKPKVLNQLILPSLLLVMSTMICSYFYLFEQNWFYTIIYNDYIGLGYVTYLLVVFLVLIDIALNKAKVTGRILDAFAHAVFSASPC